MRLASVLLLLLAITCPVQAAGPADAAARAAVQSLWPDAIIQFPDGVPACEGQPSASPPGALRNGDGSLRLRCDGATPWTRYVRVTIQAPGSLVVLTAPVLVGQPLSPSLLKVVSGDRARAPAGAIDRDSLALGQVARRPMAAGTVLTVDALAAPPAVKRGQTVSIVCRLAGMDVRAPGEALADAGVGQRVRVRNNDSRRIIEGTARADGSVEVAL